MTISEFLAMSLDGTYYDPDIPEDFFKDFMTEDKGLVKFLGGTKTKHDTFEEISMFYKFPKKSETLALSFRDLGNQISKIRVEKRSDLGIQEVDLSQPDGYYVMIYLLES